MLENLHITFWLQKRPFFMGSFICSIRGAVIALLLVAPLNEKVHLWEQAQSSFRKTKKYWTALCYMSAWWGNPFGHLVFTAAAINLNQRSFKISLLPWEYSLTNSLCHMLWLWRPYICTFLTLMYSHSRNFRCTWSSTILKLTS